MGDFSYIRRLMRFYIYHRHKVIRLLGKGPVKIHFLKSDAVAIVSALIRDDNIRNGERMSAVQRMPFHIEFTVYILQVFAIHIAAENLVINRGVDIFCVLIFLQISVFKKFDRVFIPVRIYLINFYFHPTFLPLSFPRIHLR